MLFKPHSYQKEAIQFLYDNPNSAIFADPGLGKTAIALSLISQLKEEIPKYRCLIVAPLTVCYNVWPNEIAKWKQFRHLDYGILHSEWMEDIACPYSEQLDVLCDTDLDVYLINPESLKWLFANLSNWYSRFPFHQLIIDESTRFKNWKAKRSSLLRKYLPRFKRRNIMTGTPIPNSLLDLFSQMFMVDRGDSLGKRIVPFRDTYFKKTGYKGYQWKVKEDAQAEIEKRIADTVIRIDENDHLEVPKLIENPVYVKLPKKIQKVYDEIEASFFATIDDEDIAIPTEASKYNVCRQIANGGLYKPSEFLTVPKDRKTFLLHTSKAQALENIQNELNGKPVLVGYHYRFVVPHLKKYFKNGNLPYISSGVNQKQTQLYIRLWNSNRLPMLLGQPQSIGHGLNLQKSDCKDIVWFGVPDNFESYDQFNRRVKRQGSRQKKITAHILIAKNTIESVIWRRLQKKDTNQRALLKALKRYWKRKNKQCKDKSLFI